jgi:UTP--glucose-1-phosphate uridylyltransferase
MSDDGLAQAASKMRDAGQPEGAVRAFASAYERLRRGGSFTLASADLEPLDGVPTLEQLGAVAPEEALADVAIVKLNGGLATTMGLRRPKSLVEARDGRSFLEIVVGQTLALRNRHAARLPLVLMDSEATRAPTLDALAARPELAVADLPLDFMQSMIPKLAAEDLRPVTWPSAPSLEWCPPGHGDIYGALEWSGMLATLRGHGFRYAMISNSDNLGATPEPRIASHLAEHRIPFLMEVVEGIEADRKGGHIARRRADGRLVLRETAQTPPEDAESFTDHRRWRYYNTNNLWVDLEALEAMLGAGGGVLELPLIVNRKTVDPRDPESPAVLQLESAMGAAIGSFPGARVVCVPRSRFIPVKTTDDLLLLRSDLYELADDFRVTPQREGEMPYVELDTRYYRLLDRFDARFPDGAPSLLDARRLVVTGDVTFGAGVVIRGSVELSADAPRRIGAGSILEG